MSQSTTANTAVKRGKITQLDPVYAKENADGSIRKPRVNEVLRQYIHLINPRKDRSHWLNLHVEVYFYISLFFFVSFLTQYLNIINILIFSVLFYVMSNLINTFWYHRFCSHNAFTFSSQWMPTLIMWFNPIAYREEVYAYNHLLHHRFSDTSNDPYGPHLGWLGNFFASPFYKVDRTVSKEEFEHMKKVICHIGFKFASYESFQRWGSVESVSSFIIRSTFANTFWAFLMWLLGGLELLTIWYAVIFAYHSVARDFNYRGHGGGTEKAQHKDSVDFYHSSKALNQLFYGLSAGEWHNNHHAFQRSANAGFLPYQLDVPFLFVKLLKRIGVISKYNNAQAAFERKYLSH
ncbi:hypothetical protein Q5L94_10740 [Idiomarina sp. Sol25]|uniref:hypothetical protein n=1 Tax=Idiomarina sp. Sol25 TaxID=3064000 RepID=UPI00294B3FD4|nr:hypothetical protein [Idiomarina sp. Sol25]MDV6328542.1 hypothetical protein [Idiomarina sp. Sol25]